MKYFIHSTPPLAILVGMALLSSGLAKANPVTAEAPRAAQVSTVDSVTLRQERMALLNAERDFVMKGDNITSEIIAARQAEFRALHFERIVTLQKLEQQVARDRNLAKRKARETSEAEINAVLEAGSPQGSAPSATDSRIEKRLLAEIHELDASAITPKP